MFEIKKASRSNVKLRIGMWGPSGSGKTMSSLLFAKGLVGEWDKIVLLDTENNSGELYSHLGGYHHCHFASPFTPKRYVEAINEIQRLAPNVEVIVIDSISHEWDGVGGCLSIHEKMGGKFQDWAKVTPLHNDFIQAILQAKCHVIVTGRSKIDYSVDKDDKNRTVIKKQGMKTITREGLDYEMTLAFQIEHRNHHAIVDKDRTGLFDTGMPILINEETGQLVKEWNEKGANAQPIRIDWLKEFVIKGNEVTGGDKAKWAELKQQLCLDSLNKDQIYWQQKTEELCLITRNPFE